MLYLGNFIGYEQNGYILKHSGECEPSAQRSWLIHLYTHKTHRNAITVPKCVRIEVAKTCDTRHTWCMVVGFTQSLYHLPVALSIRAFEYVWAVNIPVIVTVFRMRCNTRHHRNVTAAKEWQKTYRKKLIVGWVNLNDADAATMLLSKRTNSVMKFTKIIDFLCIFLGMSPTHIHARTRHTQMSTSSQTHVRCFQPH